MGVSWNHYLFVGCKYEYKDLEEEGFEFIEEPNVGELGVVSDHMNGGYVYVGVPRTIVDRDDGFEGILVKDIEISQFMGDDILGLCSNLGLEPKEPKVYLFTHFT